MSEPSTPTESQLEEYLERLKARSRAAGFDPDELIAKGRLMMPDTSTPRTAGDLERPEDMTCYHRECPACDYHIAVSDAAIDRLAAEVERLREALERIGAVECRHCGRFFSKQGIYKHREHCSARAALNPEKPR